MARQAQRRVGTARHRVLAALTALAPLACGPRGAAPSASTVAVQPSPRVVLARARASSELRPGPAPRWFRAGPFAPGIVGRRWPVANVVEGICVPHPSRADACLALVGGEFAVITWSSSASAQAPDAPAEAPVVELPAPDYPPWRASEVCTIVESGPDILRRCDLYGEGGPPIGFRAERTTGEGSRVPEKTFTRSAHPEPWPFHASLPSVAEALAFHGSCDGRSDDTLLCVRDAGGTYEQLAAPRPIPSNAMLAAPMSADGKMDLVAWIPGDRTFTIVLARAQRVVRFSREEAARIDDAVSSGGGARLLQRYRSCHLDGVDGRTVRYLCEWQDAAAAVELDLDAASVRVEPHPGARGSGPFGLRVTPAGQLEESVDGWRTWRAVPGPPEPPPPGALLTCHRMGCRLGDWVRLGWGPAAAAHQRW